MAPGNIDPTNVGPASAVVASLMPIVLGAATTYFKLFIDPPRDFRERIKLKRNDLLERVAMKHATLLNHSRRIDSDEVLRGDGREQPDLVDDYDREMFRLFSIFHRLEFIRFVVRISHWIIYMAIASGIVGLIVAWMFEGARTYVVGGAISLIVVELIVIAVVYFLNGRLEEYEDIT